MRDSVEAFCLMLRPAMRAAENTAKSSYGELLKSVARSFTN